MVLVSIGNSLGRKVSVATGATHLSYCLEATEDTFPPLAIPCVNDCIQVRFLLVANILVKEEYILFVSLIIFFFLGYFGGLAIADVQDCANYDIYWSDLSSYEKSIIKSNVYLRLKHILKVLCAIIIVACILRSVIFVFICVSSSLLFNGLYLGYIKGLRLDDEYS